MKKIIFVMVVLCTFLFGTAGRELQAEEDYIYLSDIEMLSYTERNSNWTPGLDECAYHETPIIIADMEFDKGISMHPLEAGEGQEAECVWDISGYHYTYFTAVIGKDKAADTGLTAQQLDQLTQTKSSFYVYLDDVLVAQETVQYGFYSVLNVPLNNASKLTLKLGDGGDGIFCDVSDFADAKLSNTMNDLKAPENTPAPETPTPDPNATPQPKPTQNPELYEKDYAYISDMVWTDYKAFIGTRGEYLMRDTNVYDEDLCISGEFFDKGVCMHAGPSITDVYIEIDITGFGYKTFAAYAGIAESFTAGASTSMGDVRFIVYGDGEELYATDAIGYDDNYELISVDITGVSVIRLAVDPVDDNSGDWAAWGSAILGKADTAEAVFNAAKADLDKNATPTRVPATASATTSATASATPRITERVSSTPETTEKNGSHTGIIIAIIVAVILVAAAAAVLVILMKKKKNKK